MSARRAPAIAVAGDACIDVYVDTASPVSAIGGNAVNVAVGLARHSLPSTLFGVLGDDDSGDRIRASLQAAKVALDGVRAARGRSWRAYIVRDDHGIARVDFEEPGVSGSYRLLPRELDALAAFDHVHLVNLADPSDTLGLLAARGVVTSYDFGRTDGEAVSVPLDVAFFSRPESERGAAADIANRALERGARLAIVTLGGQGSIAVDREQLLTLDAEPIDPVDTLGAGDSFIAAFLASSLTGSPLARAMEVARHHATNTCRHWAAWPQQQLPVNDLQPTA